MDQVLTKDSINWESEETHWLGGERLPTAPNLKAHLWLRSSGTSGKQKWVALSKQALLVSAKSVNQWIVSNEQDIWWLGLPTYHVGGLAVLARAYLSKAKVVHSSNIKWNTTDFIKDLETYKITLLSLVPTQVYDLVAEKLSAPKSVRTVFVGGGALAQDLYEQARKLGWPLLCTFGMTETCSMIACHKLSQSMKTSEFFILPHVEVKSLEETLWIKSPALLTGQMEKQSSTADADFRYIDPKKDGWLPTEDLIELKDRLLILKGRQTNSVKILGELVQIEEVENNFRNFIMQLNPTLLEKCQFVVGPVADARQENILTLFIESHSCSWTSWKQSLSAYNQTQQGPWRIGPIAWVQQLPRNAMGKVLRQELKQQFYS